MEIGMLQEYGFKNNGQRGIVTKSFKQQFHSLPAGVLSFHNATKGPYS
jgi:hypothetical protein